MMKVYGLKTCDTCRKAVKALEGDGAKFTLMDVRAEGVTNKQIEKWTSAVGWETLLNTKSTTWRELGENKSELGRAKAIALMAAHPTMIKRPVIERGLTEVHFGWSADVQRALGL